MSEKIGFQLSMIDLYKALTPLIASQLLNAFYTFLLHARGQADKRSDVEILQDVLSDFQTISALLEKSIDSLDQLDREDLFLKLKTIHTQHR